MKKNTFLMLIVVFLTSINSFGQKSWSKNKISLLSKDITSSWQFIGIDPQEGEVKLPDLNSPKWRTISVPGDVNVELMKQNVIPDMHYDTLARGAYWITSKEWWFTLEFDAKFDKAKNTDLVLDFVDGNSEVWLNGHKLGEMKNAFHPHSFNVKDILKENGNRLYVRFLSINELLGGPRISELLGWKERRAFLRKPQYNFGWDWTLPIPGIGLVGDVYIENGNEFELAEVGIQTFINGRTDFNFEVSKPTKEEGYQIVVNVSGHGTSISDTITRTQTKSYKSYTSLNIENPKLWWPNGYGDPNLYEYKVDLLVDGKVTDSKKGKFGIRETSKRELPFTKEAGTGYSYEILINNEPIFCKGTNWIPTEIWPGSISPDKYRFYLEKAKEANFNMIRVWGGGIYEDDLFYELCDEMGIMIWQDFMFASSGYPTTTLMDEIIEEAEYQIFRLRNHPSIVIWCGCNEDYLSWRHKNDAKPITEEEAKDPFHIDRAHQDPILYTMILQGLVDKYGLEVPYVESSPMSREDSGNRRNSGNSHISSWKTALFWCDGSPSKWRKHFEDVCSFDSEFCVQGPANLNTMKSFLSKQNQWPANDAWIYHIQRGHGNKPHYEQTLFIAGDIFGKINSLEEYVKHGQATQLEQTRTEYESARYDRPNNGGTMSWMYNDCWPTANWSIIDYYYQPKPAYYAAKRACSPILPIIFERDSMIRFAIANETSIDQNIEIVYGVEDFYGNSIWEKKTTIKADKNTTKEFFRIDHYEAKTPKNGYAYIKATINNISLDVVTYFPDGWKGIDWGKPNTKMNIVSQQQVDNKWETIINISADQFVRLCHLQFKKQPILAREMALPEVWFMDNYFDLTKGEIKQVKVVSAHKLKLNELKILNWQTQWQ